MALASSLHRWPLCASVVWLLALFAVCCWILPAWPPPPPTPLPLGSVPQLQVRTSTLHSIDSRKLKGMRSTNVGMAKHHPG